MRRIISFLVTLAAAGALTVAPAQATEVGNEGCTPGYWKNHTESWEEYSPTAKVSTVFRFTGTPSAVAAYSGVTMQKALALRGGTGVKGATEILLRASVASVLNAAHEGLGFPLRRANGDFDGDGDIDAGIVSLVNTALASNDRAAMLALATRLDKLNNLGCPL